MQTVQYVRVINSQKTFGNSVLLDKIDRTSGQFETDLGYAQTPKQAVYVPYVNPIDPTVPGYLDLVPSDEVTLQLYQPQGVINQLQVQGYVTVVLHHSAAVATPAITSAVHNSPAGDTTIDGPGSGATFVSLTPDHTYIIVTNLTGVSQVINTSLASFGAAGGSVAAAAIVLPNSLITGGPVVAGWKVQVQANSKLSNVFTVT
jgi:hypothetical protein